LDVDEVNIEKEEPDMFRTISQEVRKAWSDSRPLTATALLMLGLFAASVAGIALDDRIITGAPAWLKPAKFAISTAIFCGTLAWLYRYINVWPRFVRAMGWIVSSVLILEVAIIDIQAARGTTSHFNVGTTLDGVLWGTMGTAIAVLWLASIGILAALLRQKFDNRAWGWWLRMGMLVTVLGSAAGGLMVSPTPQQADTLRAGEPVRFVGAHTVGAPDGGAGIPAVGWSTEYGDLRIPHFLGLHALQILPFFGWVMLRRRGIHSHHKASGLAFAAAVSYVGLVSILTWQALRGQSIVAPDAVTWLAIGVWLAATAGTGIYLLNGAATVTLHPFQGAQRES
jgi:hypothetical protein